MLQWEDSWRPHWDDETVIVLSGKLAFEDPHPEVRINAIQHYAVEGIESNGVYARSWVQQMLAAMKNDAAPEVRAAVIRQLSYISRDFVEPQSLITRLREALTYEQNGFVVCKLLSLLVHKGRFDFQLETAVIALNHVKSTQNERFFHEQQAILKRLRNYHTHWLEAAPFENVSEFRDYLESHFKSNTASLEERVVNYRTLMQTTRPPVPNFQELMDLFFDAQQTTETIGLLLDDLGDVGFKALFAGVNSPVGLAETRAELLGRMIAHLKTKDPNGDLLGGVEPMKTLLSYGIKVAMKAPPDAEVLWSLIYQTIAEGPEDWTWSLSELKWRTGKFELEPLIALVGTAKNVSAARGIVELLVELFRKKLGRKRAEAVVEAWTLFAARIDLWNYGVYDMVYRMPKRDVFVEHPEALETIEQAMKVAQAKFKPEESPHSTIAAWLGEET